MSDSDLQTTTVPVKLSDRIRIEVEAIDRGGEKRIGTEDIFDFQEVSDAVEAIAESLMSAFRKVKPHKASVEFGIKVVVKSGKLTTLLVEGGGEANLKVNLEWTARVGSADGARTIAAGRSG